MRYVAFVDTLGFKHRITQITHLEAVEVIKLFNQTIYDLWREMHFNNDLSINGRTFSDSIIIHSQGDTNEELEKILSFLVRLYKISITICDLPLRGGLTLGQFEDIQAVEFNNLQKGLVVGTGFIDAYLLESSNNVKGSKLLFGSEINQKIQNELVGYETEKLKNDTNGNPIFELKWGNVDFLTERNNGALIKFIDLATTSKWLDHYYGTLETFLIKESSQNKNKIYSLIIERLKLKYKYADLDNFIENYMKSENAVYTKRSFLAFIRERI